MDTYTDWFPFDAVAPVRDGWYDVLTSGGAVQRMRWAGGRWEDERHAQARQLPEPPMQLPIEGLAPTPVQPPLDGFDVLAATSKPRPTHWRGLAAPADSVLH